MEVNSFFLSYKNSEVHFLRFGRGSELLISFPGYADTAAIFLPLDAALGERFTIISIDVPFHGKTKWSTMAYSKDDMVKIIQLILEREGKTEFALMGYSFGGRIVQKIAEIFQAQISSIFLLAPDGIFTRGMVNAHLVPRFVRVLFRQSLRNPEWLLFFGRQFHRLKLLSPYNLKFINYHLADTTRRDRLFSSWISMSEFVLYPARTKALFRQSKIPVNLYFGQKDEVIPLKAGKWMSEGVENVSLYILKEGHRIIGSDLIELMKQHNNKS